MIRVSIMVADAASTSAGKLYVLGGGWNMVTPNVAPWAVAALVSMSSEYFGAEYSWRLDLFGEDGEQVELEGALVSAGGSFGVRERMPNTPENAPISVPISLVLPPLDLPRGRVFEWRFSLNDEHREEWRAIFATRLPEREDSEG